MLVDVWQILLGDALRRAGHADLANSVDETNKIVARLRKADDRLAHGDGLIEVLKSEGLNVDGRIDEAAGGSTTTPDGE